MTASSPDDDDRDVDRFTIRSKVEIAFVLRAVLQAGATVTAYFGESRNFIITALLAVDTDEQCLLLDAAQVASANARLTHGGKIRFETHQDRIRILFDASSVESAEFEGRPAFRVPMPDSLRKFQRREFFRLETPVAKPLRCSMTLPDGTRFEATLVDIGLGGICISGFPESVRLESGMECPSCHIALPEVGAITTPVQIRNVLQVPLRNGTVSRRAGCKFLRLPPASETLVQRYINRLERDRRALLAER
ncbi:MAG: flagellar brake protein [Burkholderiales bacterium]|nr:flagellar brake protein [Burkholderiales bacterium]